MIIKGIAAKKRSMYNNVQDVFSLVIGVHLADARHESLIV